MRADLTMAAVAVVVPPRSVAGP